jgi:hypothetical protein
MNLCKFAMHAKFSLCGKAVSRPLGTLFTNPQINGQLEAEITSKVACCSFGKVQKLPSYAME